MPTGLVDGPDARVRAERRTRRLYVVWQNIEADGRHVLLFLASGVRHAAADEAAISRLAPGDELSIVPEPDFNEVNADALSLNSGTGERVGWIPDYLLDMVHEYRNRGPVSVYVERANGPDVPAHVRLLCRLEAHPQGS